MTKREMFIKLYKDTLELKKENDKLLLYFADEDTFVRGSLRRYWKKDKVSSSWIHEQVFENNKLEIAIKKKSRKDWEIIKYQFKDLPNSEKPEIIEEKK